ncbi:hypothetical protein GCM10010401_01390 [Rarobacter faecitabidus]
MSVTATPAQAAIAPGVNVMEWNVCHLDPECGNAGVYSKNLATASARIVEEKPAIFLAIEFCQKLMGDYQKIGNKWFAGSVFYPKRDSGNSKCGKVGTAIFTHRPLTDLGFVKIPVRVQSGALDTVGCALTQVGSNKISVVACVTHLDNSSDVTVQKAQLQGTKAKGAAPGSLTNGTTKWQGAAGWALDKANGKPMVFGGDLNLKHDSAALSHMYSNVIEDGNVSTGQRFAEVDQVGNGVTHGADTKGKKIDYIFFKKGYSSRYKVGQHAPEKFAASDHRMLYGEVRLCSDPSEC